MYGFAWWYTLHYLYLSAAWLVVAYLPPPHLTTLLYYFLLLVLPIYLECLFFLWSLFF